MGKGEYNVLRIGRYMRRLFCEDPPLWGEPKKIARELLEQCDDLIADYGVDMEDPEGEFDITLDDYKTLQRLTKVRSEDVEGFFFSLSDFTLRVEYLVGSYEELVEAYNEYAEDRFTLAEWTLPEEFDPTEENLIVLSEEIQSLNEDDCPEDFVFLLPNEEEF